MGPKSCVRFVNFARGYLERDRLIRLSSEQKILPLSIWGLDLLLVCRHKSVARYDPLCYLRVIHLEEQALLAILRVPLLSDPVPRPANLDKLLDINPSLLRSRLDRSIRSFLGSSSCQVALMLLSLGMCQVGSLVVMQGQTQLTFVGTKMVSHEIWVLGKIDSFSSKSCQPLPAVPV